MDRIIKEIVHEEVEKHQMKGGSWDDFMYGFKLPFKVFGDVVDTIKPATKLFGYGGRKKRRHHKK